MIEILSGISGVQDIPIDSITTLWAAKFPGAEVLRDHRALNKTHVNQLSKCLDNCPPIELVRFRDNGQVTNNYQAVEGFALVDGRHRYEAARKLERGSIKSNVDTYKSVSEVVHLAIVANNTHGSPSSATLKMVYALYLVDRGVKTENAAMLASVTESGIKSAIRRRQKQEKAESEPEAEVPVELSPLDQFTMDLCNSIIRLYDQAKHGDVLGITPYHDYDPSDTDNIGSVGHVISMVSRLLKNGMGRDKLYDTRIFIEVMVYMLNKVLDDTVVE